MPFVKVTYNFYQNNKAVLWLEAFNQATIFNFDTTAGITVNDWPLPPATLTGGNVYPSFLELNGNTDQINDTVFKINCSKSGTADFRIIYTLFIQG